MNPKTQDEKFYEIADKALFGLEMQLHPSQLAAIAMLDDYYEVDEELAQLEQVIEDLKVRYQNRAEQLAEARRNG